jgi:hypothetical protein
MCDNPMTENAVLRPQVLPRETGNSGSADGAEVASWPRANFGTIR